MDNISPIEDEKNWGPDRLDSMARADFLLWTSVLSARFLHPQEMNGVYFTVSE